MIRPSRTSSTFWRSTRGLERAQNRPPYGERERRLDESTISYIVPTLRASLGWSPPESQATLDQWEREARARLAKYNGRNLQRGV